jgi:hypothetical protein
MDGPVKGAAIAAMTVVAVLTLASGIAHAQIEAPNAPAGERRSSATAPTALLTPTPTQADSSRAWARR